MWDFDFGVLGWSGSSGFWFCGSHGLMLDGHEVIPVLHLLTLGLDRTRTILSWTWQITSSSSACREPQPHPQPEPFPNLHALFDRFPLFDRFSAQAEAPSHSPSP